MPPPSPPYRLALFVLASELFCFFPVITDTGSRYIGYPDGIRVIEFADQDAPVKIRYHANIMGCTALAEPRRIVFGNFDIDLSSLPFCGL
jgi:hypothetical protein